MEKTASTKNTTYTLVAIALMTAVICVLAPLSLPIGPVPISMATLVLFLSIYVLGWKKATISVCQYILLGLVGVPVFSGFTGGLSKLAGATGGYIVGYIPMVALAGFLMSKSDKWWLHLLAMVAGEVVLYLIGTVWFCVQAGKTASAALAICVYPFIPLDIVKMVIVVLIGPMISSRLKKAHLNV